MTLVNGTYVPEASDIKQQQRMTSQADQHVVEYERQRCNRAEIAAFLRRQEQEGWKCCDESEEDW